MASVLLTLMTMYPFQFRFADTEQYVLGSPPTLIDWLPSWLITLTFFRCEGNVAVVPGRDHFPNECEVSNKVRLLLHGGRHLHGFRLFREEKIALANSGSGWHVAFSRDSSTFVRACCGLPGSSGRWWKGVTLIADAVGHDRPCSWAP